MFVSLHLCHCERFSRLTGGQSGYHESSSRTANRTWNRSTQLVVTNYYHGSSVWWEVGTWLLSTSCKLEINTAYTIETIKESCFFASRRPSSSRGAALATTVSAARCIASGSQKQVALSRPFSEPEPSLAMEPSSNTTTINPFDRGLCKAGYLRHIHAIGVAEFESQDAVQRSV